MKASSFAEQPSSSEKQRRVAAAKTLLPFSIASEERARIAEQVLLVAMRWFANRERAEERQRSLNL